LPVVWPQGSVPPPQVRVVDLPAWRRLRNAERRRVRQLWDRRPRLL
jgi:hypothetical protein